MTANETSQRHGGRWYHPYRVGRSIADQPRLYMGATAWLAAYLLLPKSLASAQRDAAAWCFGGLVYLAFAFWSIKHYTVDLIAARAARQDQSGIVIFGLILLAILSSFVAIAGLLHDQNWRLTA